MATTEQQLQEQLDLANKKINLSQSQLEASYKLAQEQLAQKQLQEETSSNKLAQQAYVQKEQSQRVAPNVLSAMGVANTGYENVYGSRLESTYKGQASDIQYNLDLAKQSIEQQRASAALAREQELQSLELERESAALDYRQALERLRESQSVSSSNSYANINGLSQVQINTRIISQDLQNKVNSGELTKLQALQKAEDYYNDDKIDYTHLISVKNDVMRGDVVAYIPPSSKSTLNTNQTSKLNKALAVGGR